MVISMLKIRRPLGRLIFNMGIAIPGKTVFLIETAPWGQEEATFQGLDKNILGTAHAISLMKHCVTKCRLESFSVNKNELRMLPSQVGEWAWLVGWEWEGWLGVGGWVVGVGWWVPLDREIFAHVHFT